MYGIDPVTPISHDQPGLGGSLSDEERCIHE
jgi:hypothetical protein